MAENQTFIPAPPGLTTTMKDGTQLPIVAFRVEGYELFPYYVESDGSSGQVVPGATVTAAWNP
ncbi:hypothetical protein [Mycobacterium gordonae]|uniref:hypothetical protein n=1 Tax=Mycobacterium TaxID=1763 RepID=UPI000A9F81C3|nr:hypothetical protein [Mycobacterium gordonae]